MRHASRWSWFLPVATLALAACSAPAGGGDPDAARPIDAADVDAAVDAPIDAAIDAAIDAPPDPCIDLGLGAIGDFHESFAVPKQGDQLDVVIGWTSFFVVAWRDVEGVMAAEVSQTASVVTNPHRIAGGAPTAIGCLPAGNCAIGLRDPVGLMRVTGSSMQVDAAPVVDPAMREIVSIGAAANQFLIVFRDANTGGWAVQRYGPMGAALDAAPRALPPLATGTPVVAGCDGTGCLLVYPADHGRFRVPWVGAIGAVGAPPGPWDRVACTQAGCLWASKGTGFLTDTAGDNGQQIALPDEQVMALAPNNTSFELVTRTAQIDDWHGYRISSVGAVAPQGALPAPSWTSAITACTMTSCNVVAEQTAVDGEVDVAIVPVDQNVQVAFLHHVDGGNAQSHPLLASNGTTQLVAWIDRRLGPPEWRIARRQPDGTWLDTDSRLLPAPARPLPTDAALTWTGHDFLLTWIDGAPTRALRAVRISAAGAIVDARELVAGAFRGAVACTQDVCLAIATEPGAAGAEHRLRRFDAATLAPIGDPAVIAGGVGLGPVFAAADGARFAVVTPAGAGHELRRVAIDGTVADSPPIAVADAQLHALVGRADGFALAGSQVAGGTASLRFVGAALGPRIALVPEAIAPALGSLGDDVIVTWKYPDSVAARRFDPTGAGGATRPIAGADAAQVTLAGGPAGQVLAAWSEFDPADAIVAPRLRVRRLCGP